MSSYTSETTRSGLSYDVEALIRVLWAAAPTTTESILCPTPNDPAYAYRLNDEQVELLRLVGALDDDGDTR